MKAIFTVLILVMSTSSGFADKCEFRAAAKQELLLRSQLELSILERELATSTMTMHQSEEDISSYTSSLSANTNKLYAAIKCLETNGYAILPQNEEEIFANQMRIRTLQMELDGFATKRTKVLHHNAYYELGRADGVMKFVELSEPTK